MCQNIYQCHGISEDVIYTIKMTRLFNEMLSFYCEAVYCIVWSSYFLLIVCRSFVVFLKCCLYSLLFQLIVCYVICLNICTVYDQITGILLLRVSMNQSLEQVMHYVWQSYCGYSHTQWVQFSL